MLARFDIQVTNDSTHVHLPMATCYSGGARAWSRMSKGLVSNTKSPTQTYQSSCILFKSVKQSWPCGLAFKLPSLPSQTHNRQTYPRPCAHLLTLTNPKSNTSITTTRIVRNDAPSPLGYEDGVRHHGRSHRSALRLGACALTAVPLTLSSSSQLLCLIGNV